MSYVGRAVRRIAPGAASSAPRPAMPSRSPLAEADQRLNIDAFASRFDPVVKAGADQGIEEEALASDEFDLRVERDVGDVASQSPKPGSLPKQSDSIRLRKDIQPGVIKPSAQPMARLSREIREASRSSPATPVSGHPVERRSRSTPSVPERLLPVPTFRPPEAHRASRDDKRPNIQPVAHTAMEVSDTASRSPSPLERTGEPLRNRRADALTEALKRAMAWVGNQPSPAGDSRASGPQPARGRQAVPEPPPTPFAREAGRSPAQRVVRDTRPVTHLEIGKIEVEIVPPAGAQKAPVAPARPATQGLSGYARQAFGWRQR